MSQASYGVNDALAVKLWSKDLAKAERANLDLMTVMGDDEDSILQVLNDLQWYYYVQYFDSCLFRMQNLPL